MEPFYFGKTDSALFGAYHPPLHGADARAGIVLCYPMGQEYIRAHRAFLRLAVLLSSRGFHVLRFDYFGCGDSAGEFEDARLRRWIEDVETAVEELRGGCGIRKTYIVGLRLGATLAVEAGCKRGDIDGVVLWEPVVNGGAYIDELISDHNLWLRGSFARAKTPPSSGPPYEVLGFPISADLAVDIESIDLLSIGAVPSPDALLIESNGIVSKDELIDTFRRRGASVRCEVFPGTEVWIKKRDEMSKSMVPVNILDCIGAWIDEVSR